MLYAALICCDDDCTEVFEAYGTLEELETLACDCGCALEIISLSEVSDPPARDHGLELLPVG
jgi:hypothetical protein